MKLKKFNISRINTDFGILRISGVWHTKSTANLSIDTIEIMGTDGWVLLDQLNDGVAKLITDVSPTLQAHLLLATEN